VSHRPAMRRESRRAGSPGSPPSRSHKGPLRSVPHPQPPGPLWGGLLGCPQEPGLGLGGASLLPPRL
jgi:hypothetical protein